MFASKNEFPDLWEEIPLEIACEIIGLFNELEEISQLKQVSSKFENLVKLCLKEVNHKTKTLLPIKYFEGFERLERVGDQIILVLHNSDFPILATLPRLKSANFYLPEANLDNFVSQVKKALDLLKVENKIPVINYRFIGKFPIGFEKHSRPVGLIIQGSRYGSTSSLPDLIKLIDYKLEYVPIIIKPRDFSMLMTRALRDFLRKGEFGPAFIPSEINPPLKEYLIPLANSGWVRLDLLIDLFSIYAKFNHLETPDQLILSLFDLKAPEISKLSYDEAVSQILDAEGRVEFIEDIPKYDLPVYMDNETYNLIKNVIKQTRKTYKRLRDRRRDRLNPN